MRRFRLTARQRRRLRAQVRATRDAHAARRGFALLALADGVRPSHVAETFGVTRQTIYNWIARFEDSDGAVDLEDRPRAHGSPKMTELVRRFLRWSLTQPPDELGYASGTWTVSMLREHIATWMADAAGAHRDVDGDYRVRLDDAAGAAPARVPLEAAALHPPARP